MGFAWFALALQVEAIARWQLESPFEVTLAVRNTKGAALGGFAEGWEQPGRGFGAPITCIEDHVLLRFEFDDVPEPEKFALRLGDHLEQAFGTTHRRYLAHRGPYEDQFDPRFAF